MIDRLLEAASFTIFFVGICATLLGALAVVVFAFHTSVILGVIAIPVCIFLSALVISLIIDFSFFIIGV